MEDEIAGLYALPLNEFTPERDALAKRLRTAGDREAADRVKRLRKPSVAAWALNRVRHEHGKDVDRLLEAGGALRAAQQALLDRGDRDALRDASATERALVEELAALAEAELAAAGHPVNPAISAKLRSTLHATASDDEARELLLAGRLLHEYELSDLGLAGIAPSAATAPKPKPKQAPRREREAAEARMAEARQAQKAARREREQAERQLGRAERALEAAQRGLEEAEAEAAQAKLDLAAAEQLADEAREQEREATRALQHPAEE